MEKIRLFFKGFYDGFKSFSMLVANISNFTLLMVVYFTALGITSIIGKSFGKQFLEICPKRDTHWRQRVQEVKKLEDYFRQF